jgi:3-oxoacyl-(acyl-carrier-protein) synthase
VTYILGHTSFTSSNFEIKRISKLKDISVEIGKLNLEKERDYFPTRSDQKVMRDDIKMSIVTAQEILNKYGFSNETISRMPLFIANGSFLGNFEKHLSRVLNVFKDVYEGSSRKEIYKKIYRVSPPLLALETLTNSNMSFIAQYTGLKGNNATFGNTSISTYYALRQGINEINKGEEYTLVSSSNDASIYYHLMNRTVSEIN